MAETGLYLIHNMARDRSSRFQRTTSVTRHDVVLWVLGRRVIPKRPIAITPEEYTLHEQFLLGLVREGRISITTPDKTLIDSMPNGNLFYVTPGKPISLVDLVALQKKPAEPPTVEPVVVSVAPPIKAVEAKPVEKQPEPVVFKDAPPIPEAVIVVPAEVKAPEPISLDTRDDRRRNRRNR